VDEGRAIAVGTHSGLLGTCEKYRLLIESQILALEPEVMTDG
jgi:hypothetical protein